MWTLSRHQHLQYPNNTLTIARHLNDGNLTITALVQGPNLPDQYIVLNEDSLDNLLESYDVDTPDQPDDELAASRIRARALQWDRFDDNQRNEVRNQIPDGVRVI